MEPRERASAGEPGGEREPFKRIGCTALTIVVMILLACSVVYFLTGTAGIIVGLLNNGLG